MRATTLLKILFIVSGAAGLVYESIWSRYLGLFVGHSAYAQIVVLVIYLGGMSVGALLAGSRSQRIRNPLVGYAWAEAAVGVLGLVFHPLYVAATGMAYDSWFPALAGTPWHGVVKWSLASALILPQSVLLGTTFPLMSAAVLRRAPESPGRTIAFLYFSNSFGAAAGAILSGFVLVGALGLPGTVITAALLNLGVAAASLAIATRRGEKPGVPMGRPERPLATSGGSDERGGARDGGAASGSSGARAGQRARSVPRGVQGSLREASQTLATPDRTLVRLLLLVSFGTAVASFIYEIGWIRMLSLVLGSATRSFEIMLSAFILGLALGALWVRTRADRFPSPLQALGLLQWAMGSLALATLPVYIVSFHWMSILVSSLPHDDGGYRWFTLARYGISLAVMLPATFCAGTTLPLLTRLLMTSGQGEKAIGLVYGVNTLGSILGAGAAGLVLLPLLGLKGLLVFGALVDVSLGIALLAYAGRTSEEARRWMRGAAVAMAGLVVLVALFVPMDPHLLTSGVYRSGLIADPSIEIVSFRDGRTASVSLERYPASASLTLSTNGKGDASLRTLWLEPPERRPRTVFQFDESTQALTAIVPLAFAPAATEAAVVGQGSGMTSHYLLGSPNLRRVVTIEIEPEVIRASRGFFPANRRVFEDPRSRFVIDDAKSFFAAENRRYDLIVSEPSNPWVSGNAGLFSTEFYARVTRQLTERGIFGQWLHAYELNDDLALSVLAALSRNFRHYQVFLVNHGDVLIVATNRGDGLVPDWSVARYPMIAADLANLPELTPNLLEALRVADGSIFEPLLRSEVRANSDYRPILDVGAERARFLGLTADGLLYLHEERFGLARLASRVRIDPILDWPVPVPAIPRHRDLSMASAMRRPPQGIAPQEIDERLPAMLQRRARMQATFSAAGPPPDWRGWVYQVAQAEMDWHLGTAGVVDEGFYGLLRSYMDRWQAPSEARTAVGYLHDLASWRLPEAARRADSLSALAAQGRDWMPPSLLLDGAVPAQLLVGDLEGARRTFGRVLPRVRRNPSDLRTRILRAHLEAPAAR
jgi:spermidine synthase